MKTDELSAIRARLWDSVELRYIRTYALAPLPILAVGLVLMWFALGLGGRNGTVFLIPVLLAAVICVVPVLAFWLWRVLRIFRKPEHYRFFHSELIQPHSYPLNRNAYCFMAVIEEPQGNRFAVETHSIFRVRNIPGPKMREYAGKTVTIAWNRETEMVVVIG